MDTFYQTSDIMRITQKSRSTIWRWIRAGRFPKPMKIGPNSNAWTQEQLVSWVHVKKETGNDA